MAVYKIIFTGPVGAGKTTAISSLSDIPPVKTDRLASDMTRERKPETTVAMDYGLVNLANGVAIHLYGTPGQERFDFMWEILVEGGIGLVLLIDNTRPDPFVDLRFFVKAFRKFIDQTGVVIGVTRTDIRAQPAIEDYYRELAPLGLASIPVFEVDARKRKDVSLLVEALLCSLDPLAAA
ncbi:MAG: ATP/GTP-binding protein [Dechloromonas sp.]|uniref:ATP/GTP-binding protein n=1 Tax=Candidatus Dechloromonas phosphorivorans TaxID=2899244 RepID=A0A935MQX6_9RHOO|nr:ATP/GTP-binding protein [Candidatus Dechloromonas phosphorivorans]